MDDQDVTLTREQLFELVWSRPISQLSKIHGICDATLARLCASRKIPTPPRGYWTEVRAGREPKRPRLPSSADESLIHLPPPVRSAEEVATEAASGETKDRIVVSERLQAPVAIVAEARDALRDVPDDENGLLKCPRGCVPLRVSRKQLSLALCVADALFKECEGRGWRVRRQEEHAVAVVDTIPIVVDIVESFDRIEVPPEPKPHYYSFNYNRNASYTSRPSGHLTISIDSVHRVWQYGVRRTWRGSERRPVAVQLSSVLAGMQKLAEAVRASLEEQSRREREAAERERAAEQARMEQERAQRAAAEEKARVEDLLEQARRWQTSHALRAFIETVRARGAAGKLNLHGKDLPAWIEWACRQADRLDPFVPPPTLARHDAAGEVGTSN